MSTPNHTADGGNLRARAIRGGVFSLASQGGRLVIQIGTTAILARLLSPGEFGLVAMVIPFVALVQLLQDAGLPSITLQRQDITEEQIATLFWTNMMLATVMSGVLALCAPLVAGFFDDDRLTAITIAFAALLIPAAAGVQHRALLQRNLNFRTLAIIDISIQLIATAVAVVVAWHGFGYWALVVHAATLPIVQLPMLWLAVRWSPGRPRGFSEARHLLRAGGEIAGFNLLNYFARNLDNILIGKVWGEAALGLYGRAYNLMLTPVNQINAPVGHVAVPLLSKLAHDPARYRNAYRQILEKMLLVTMPGIVVLIVAAPSVVLLLFGPKWLEAAPILAALGVTALVQPANNSTGWLYVSQGRTRDLFRWGFIGTPLQVAAIVAGLPWGPMGVAISYAAVNVLVITPLIWWRVDSPCFRAKDFAAAVAPFAASSVLSGGALLLGGGLLPDHHPLLVILASCAWTYGCQLAILLALPRHRRVVLELVAVAMDAMRMATRPRGA